MGKEGCLKKLNRKNTKFNNVNISRHVYDHQAVSINGFL